MKSKALLTILGAGLLASAAFPALAEEDFQNSWVEQLQKSDGPTEPAAAPVQTGAAGRPGAAADTGTGSYDPSFLQQLEQTDGYTAPANVPTSRIGAAGRSAQSTDDGWLEKQLRMGDSIN